jgi:hypothetical protein
VSAEAGGCASALLYFLLYGTGNDDLAARIVDLATADPGMRGVPRAGAGKILPGPRRTQGWSS